MLCDKCRRMEKNNGNEILNSTVLQELLSSNKPGYWRPFLFFPYVMFKSRSALDLNDLLDLEFTETFHFVLVLLPELKNNIP